MKSIQANSFVYPVRVLEDECLRLEPILNAEDYSALLVKRFGDHPEVFDFLPSGPFRDASDFYDQWLGPIVDTPTLAGWHIVVKNAGTFQVGDETKSGESVGMIGFLNTEERNDATEIGFVIIAPAWHRTFVSTHAIGLLLRYALDLPGEGGLGLRRVAWQCNARNTASRRAAERMGFTYEGRLRWARILKPHKVNREGREHPDKRPGRDSEMLSMTWEDWMLDGKREHVEALMKRPLPDGTLSGKT